jgi:DNA repair exonuclease SbcCD ATPase subunit
MPIDEGKDASAVADALAHALDGGPREDAARGALKRIDDALRTHVGTKQARKNAPLRALRERLDDERRSAEAARAALARLDELRARIEGTALHRERLAAAASEAERRVRGRRAGLLRARLADLRAWREQYAEVQAARAVFDDVATFDADRESEAIDAYHAAETAAALALRAQEDAERARLSDEETHELADRRADAGRIDERAFAELASAAQDAAAARARATAAANEARLVRPASAAGGFFGALLVLGLVALCAAVGFAIAHDWFWTPVCGAIAVALLGISTLQGRSRAVRVRAAAAQQQRADDALAAEGRAAAAIAAILDPIGVLSVEELGRRRERLADLETKYTAANAALARAGEAQRAATLAADAFAAVAAALVPDVAGSRAAARAAIAQRAARKRERDGIDARLRFLDVQKSTILGSADDYALEAELAELLAAGVEPLDDDSLSLRAIEDERAAVVDALRGVERELAAMQGELGAAERAIPDLPALDEAMARTEAEIARLEAFERALVLAKETLTARTEEAHSSFARRLEDYAAGTFSTITAGRYGELRVNPATLEITVRIPETQAIEKIEFLSAGTRDQAYLVVRFAMARMFAEGGETPPLLLDDPFAYWDAQRIERCLPIVERGALEGQTLLFTASEELARAAAARGARRIDLSASVYA